jgi:DeoR/GlpR family transcriptional regulator of sugar metabolism
MKKKGDAETRREQISNIVIKQGFVSIKTLMELLGVSLNTIHRDLDGLEKLHILKKVRNGARTQLKNHIEIDFNFRQAINVKAKKAIAKVASEFIENGDTFMMDNSTTVFKLIPFLSRYESLTIITGGLPAMLELIKLNNIHLISIGGDYHSRYQCFSGLMAQQNIEKMMANKCFISCASYKDGTIFHSTEHILGCVKTMLNHSIKKYLLFDHSKFENTALRYTSDIKIFDAIIVDEGISASNLENLKACNKNILVAKLE